MSELIEKINQLQIGESLTLGSGAADVRITGIGVSAKHTRIERKEMGVFIRDLGSSSGTFVNKKKLAGSQRLKSGDVIKIGQTEWTFSAVECAPLPSTEKPIRTQKKTWAGFLWKLIFRKN